MNISGNEFIQNWINAVNRLYFRFRECVFRIWGYSFCIQDDDGIYICQFVPIAQMVRVHLDL